MLITSVLILFATSLSFGKDCPAGGPIYDQGISSDGMVEVTDIHNKYRLDIANGLVPNQPRGVNLLRMQYDVVLGEKASVVSDTCKLEHIIAEDDRWSWVGQNIFMSWSTAYTTGQNWTAAVTSWFNEYEDFIYPSSSKPGKTTGHYTQVVWANTDHIGCDFIHFYDVGSPSYPYAKMYTCNYGPGGNYVGEAPYETGTSGCENLC